MTTLVDMGGNTLITENIRVGATSPGQAGTDISSAEIAVLDGVTAGTAAANKAVVLGATARVAGVNGITSSVAGVVVPMVPTAVQQAINANGAINITSYFTAITSVTTTGVAYTLADSTVLGQLKKMQLVADGGSDAVVTFNTNATITFADAGDVAVVIWNGTDWIPIELSNDADGATAPVYVAAS